MGVGERQTSELATLTRGSSGLGSAEVGGCPSWRVRRLREEVTSKLRLVAGGRHVSGVHSRQRGCEARVALRRRCGSWSWS